MSEPLQPPPRPLARRRPDAEALAWLRWFGLARLVAAAVSVAVVVAGAVWLLQSPSPSTESALPVAGAAAGTAAAPASTLALPDTVAVVTTVADLGPIVVHVAGAVTRPGLVELAGHARVADAVAAAGGPSGDAQLDAVNLAAALIDGQRVYVPRVGEVEPIDVPGAPQAGAGSATEQPSGPVDLNSATVDQLETLNGVGPATASAIVDDRERNGPFATVDELDRVPGIGPAKLAALRDQVTV